MTQAPRFSNGTDAHHSADPDETESDDSDVELTGEMRAEWKSHGTRTASVSTEQASNAGSESTGEQSKRQRTHGFLSFEDNNNDDKNHNNTQGRLLSTLERALKSAEAGDTGVICSMEQVQALSAWLSEMRLQ
jgi:hypothetical protein